MAQTKKKSVARNAIGSSRGKKSKINWMVAGPLVIVAIIGAFGIYKLVGSSAAAPKDTRIAVSYYDDGADGTTNILVSKQGSVTESVQSHPAQDKSGAYYASFFGKIYNSTTDTEFTNEQLLKRECKNGKNTFHGLSPEFAGPEATNGSAKILYNTQVNTSCEANSSSDRSDVWVVNLDGSNARQITNAKKGQYNHPVGMDVDSNTVYYTENDKLMSRKGNKEPKVLKKSISSASLSGNGKKIAYQKLNDNDNIHIMLSDGTKDKVYKQKNRVSNITTKSLNKNGSKLIFCDYNSSNDKSQVKVLDTGKDTVNNIDTVNSCASDTQWSDSYDKLVYSFYKKSNKTLNVRIANPNGSGKKDVFTKKLSELSSKYSATLQIVW